MKHLIQMAAAFAPLMELDLALTEHANGIQRRIKHARPHIETKYEGTGRNEPCPCGSGAKFKKCCINQPQGATPEK